MLRIIKILEDTTVDGPGFRTAIYCSGCYHKCAGCHNPQSWDIEAGREMSIAEIMEKIKADPFANVTFTGGDPIYQAEGFALLAETIKKETAKDIWCYTGFLYEQLLNGKYTEKLLQNIDVLVDGPYIEEQKDPDLLFRGSTNQRLIDVKRSLAAGEVVLWERDF
ncbi:MAG: anaerobic ribonucleoside-triphosphate reductase activating protein [Prevotella sp.]|nr:anaerobic ribonucleoside-triphosphate reductase activating protein [Prevotella sp.]